MLREMDHDVADALAAAMRRRGIALHTGTEIIGGARDGARRIVRFRDASGEHEVAAAQVVCALGRMPATNGLALEAAGVARAGGRANPCWPLLQHLHDERCNASVAFPDPLMAQGNSHCMEVVAV